MEEERKKVINKIKNMTSNEKKSSLLAPFWDDKTEVDKNTPFMKEIEKIWYEQK